MTRRRYELTDHEWSILSPLLPNKPRSVPRADDRRVPNGILWRFQKDAAEPGPAQTRAKAAAAIRFRIATETTRPANYAVRAASDGKIWANGCFEPFQRSKSR